MISDIDYSNKFTAFTDGSSLNNNKNAAAGFAVYFPSTKILIAKSMRGTNNQAELEAMRYCLWYISEKCKDIEIPDNTIHIFSDSEYVINAVTGKHKSKANVEKINICKMLISKLKEKYLIEFHHVFAHTKGTDFMSKYNALVDHAAREKAKELQSTG